MKSFEFHDRDGVVWKVEWREAGHARARIVGNPDGSGGEGYAGFQFTCPAITFRAPWAEFTDPRAVRPEVLQRMIDRALTD